jgi:hypothetical protein
MISGHLALRLRHYFARGVFDDFDEMTSFATSTYLATLFYRAASVFDTDTISSTPAPATLPPAVPRFRDFIRTP